MSLGNALDQIDALRGETTLAAMDGWFSQEDEVELLRMIREVRRFVSREPEQTPPQAPGAAGTIEGGQT